MLWRRRQKVSRHVQRRSEVLRLSLVQSLVQHAGRSDETGMSEPKKIYTFLVYKPTEDGKWIAYDTHPIAYTSLEALLKYWRLHGHEDMSLWIEHDSHGVYWKKAVDDLIYIIQEMEVRDQ